MILNLNQNGEQARGLLVRAFLNDTVNKGIYALYFPFNRAAGSYLSNLTLLENETKNKARNGNGILTKDEQKKLISKDFGLVLSQTADFATLKNNTELLAQVNFPESYIYKMKDAEVYPFITNLQENVYTTAFLADVDFIKYEITDQNIQDIVDDAAEFKKKIGDNKLEDKEASVANDAMNKIITDLHKDIVSMDRNVGKFASDFPDFVNGYYKCTLPIKDGVRHQGKSGFVFKAGVKQPGAIIRINGTDKMAVADEEAYYELTIIKVGKYKATVTLKTGESKEFDIEIHRRKIDDQNFNMD